MKFKLILVAMILAFGAVSTRAAYDINAPAEAVIYSEAQKATQREAGNSLTLQIKAAIAAGEKSFTVSPGVYRIEKAITFKGVKNFTLNMAGAEFFIGKDAFLYMENCENLAFIGPAKVDAETYPLTQGVIRSYDATSGLTQIEILSGYEVGDSQKGTVDAFSTGGVYLENPSWASYENLKVLDAKRRLVQAKLQNKQSAIYQPGHLLALRLHDSDNLLVSRNVKGFTIKDFDVYTAAGISWGSGSGNWNFIRVRGIPRPGTNRLTGAGGCQRSHDGGAVLFDSCEFSVTADDLIDYGGGGTFMVVKQETPRVVITWRGKYGIGDTLNFYGHTDFYPLGSATVVAVEELKDAALQSQAHDVVKNINKGRDAEGDQPLRRVTLSHDMQVAPGNFADNATSNRADQFIIRNCYFHDAGVRVMIQGFKQGLFENNVFERISGGLAMTVDVWWWGGPVVQDVTIRNNIFKNTTFRDGWGTGRAAIVVGADKAPNRPAKNGMTHKVVIIGNQISDSSRGGIFVGNATDVIVKDNVITNAQSLKGESAIVLNGVFKGEVTGNTISKSGGKAITVSNSSKVKVLQNTGGNAAVEMSNCDDCTNIGQEK